MKRFCLIGHPVAGSLSPVLMEAAYHGRYSYDLVDEDSFEKAWERALSYDGFNITAPYKLKAAAMLGMESPVNLILPTDSGLRGFNTDIDGVEHALNSVPRGKAAVVGTGGAALAAKIALERLGCETILMAGRNPLKADVALDSIPGDIDIMVYTLPGSAPVPEGLPTENAIVLEAEYRTPRLTNIACKQYISGKIWLLHQAITGFRHLTGEEPDIKKMKEVLGL